MTFRIKTICSHPIQNTAFVFHLWQARCPLLKENGIALWMFSVNVLSLSDCKRWSRSQAACNPMQNTKFCTDAKIIRNSSLFFSQQF